MDARLMTRALFDQLRAFGTSFGTMQLDLGWGIEFFVGSDDCKIAKGEGCLEKVSGLED